MIIKRKENHSKKKKREGKKKNKIVRNSTLGSGILTSGILLERNLGRIQKKIVSSTEKVPEYLKKENKKLFKKLQKQAKRNNVEVITTNQKQSEGLNKKIVNFKSGPYSLNAMGPYTAKEELKYADLENELKNYKDNIRKHKKVLEENPDMKKEVNNYNSILHKKRNRAKFKADSNSFVVIPGENGKNPLAADLSHELGHLDGIGNRSKSKLNNYFHRDSNFVRKINKNSKKISNSASIVTGLATGIKDGKEKNNKISDEIKSSTAIITASTVPHANILGREYNATKSGLKKLKESGASKKYIKFTKKRLGRAYGTYVARVTPSILMGLGSRELGKIVGNKLNKEK